MLGCPDDSALASFLNGGSGNGAVGVGEHLLVCTTCRLLISAAAPVRVAARVPRGDLVAEQSGRYQLDGECGRGGQSIVWIAFDRNLGCQVAFKVLQLPPFDRDAQARARTRFLREARIAASLSHPAIVPVHELGTRADGSLYYTMKLVRGQTLAEAVAGARTLDRRLALLGHVVDVCQGIAYAHSQGVVHRDIKPGNVMVGEFGETIIVDWGLAKPIGERGDAPGADVAHDDPPHETASGAAVGTPAYMSPEQAGGRIDEVGERTDVWGLGTLVYELLAGAPPFTGDRAAEVIDRVVRGDRPAVAASCPGAPPELVAIAERALARDPADRHAGADELATELSAYLAGRRVDSYRYSMWELVARFASMHRAAFVALVAIAGIALVSTVAVAVAYRGEASERERAQAATRAETSARQRATAALTRALADKAEQLSSQGNHLAAQVYAAGALTVTTEQAALEPALRLRAVSVVHEAAVQPVIGLIERFTPGSRIGQLRLSADGRTAIATDERALTVYSLDQRKVAATRVFGSEPIGLDVAADGAVLVITPALDQSLAVSAGAVRPLLSAANGAVAREAAVSPDTRTIATGDDRGTITLWDAGGHRLGQLDGHHGPILALAFSADGSQLASGSTDGTVRVWDVARARPLATFRGHDNAIRDLAFARDGDRVVSAGQDRTLRIWSLQAPDAPAVMLDGHHTPVSAVAVSTDGRLLASGDYEGQFRLWDLRTGELLVAVQAHESAVANELGSEISALAFSADGSRLATGSADGSAAIWSLRPPAEFAARLPALPVFYSELSMDGRALAIPCANRKVSMFDLSTGAAIQLPPIDSPAQAVALSPDAELLALAGADGAIRVWDRRRQQLHAIAAAHPGGAVGAEFSPDGSILVTGGDDGVVKFWQPETLAPAGEIRGRGEAYSSFAYSPDGTLLAGVDADGAITVWRTDSRAEVARVDAAGWNEVGFSHDGSRLIAAGKNGFQIWRTGDWQVIGHVDTGSFYPRAVYTAGDRSILTASFDGTIRIWSADDLSPLISIPTTTPTAVAMPDGRSLIMPRGTALHSVAIDRAIGDRDPGELLRASEAALRVRLDGFDLRAAGD